MALFNKFFKRDPLQNQKNLPNTKFGRFLSCNKLPAENKKYKQANKLFDSQDFLGSFDYLLDYLNDPIQQNIVKLSEKNKIQFSLFQGNQKLIGSIDNECFEVYASLGKYEQLSPSLFRHILTKNHNLHYSCFAIRQNEIVIKAISKTSDSSPEKLFFMLKEVALTAENEADVIWKEFPFLSKNEDYSTINMSENEVSAKIKYLKIWIKDSLEIVSKLNLDRDAVFVSYHLLALLFRIDFLLVPVGEVKQSIIKCLNAYNQKNASVSERIDLMKTIFKELLLMNDKELANSFLNYKYTFSFIEATSHKTVYEFILKQFEETSRLTVKSDEKIHSLILFEYILGYCMFYFGVFLATKRLITLMYMVLYPDFFADLGFKSDFFNSASKALNRSQIEKEISDIIKEERKYYPHLSIISTNINFNDLPLFMKTLLNEITYLNFAQPEI
jgi:hypothetical protein